MKKFNDRRGGKGGGGRSNRFEKRSGGGSDMHSATCSDCGNKCEVPFKPRGDKPVLCSKCFKNDNGDRSKGGKGYAEKTMHSAICSDCGNPCKVPFKPSDDKPVRCSDCFKESKGDDFRSKDSFRPKGKFQSKSYSKPEKNYDKEFEFLRYEIEDLNEKLDKALKILNILRPEKKVFTFDKEEVETTSEEEKPAEEKKKIAKKAPAKKKAAPKKKAVKKTTKATKKK